MTVTNLANGVYIPSWQILYGGVNITGNLLPHAAHVHYSECISGKASILEIALEDASAAFQNNPPTVGTTVGLSIGYQGTSLVSCGNFEIDEWEFKGPPDLFILRAIQAGISHSIRTPKSSAYEGQSLVAIANTIAARYGLTVVSDAVNPDVSYQRLTQRTESDLGFLHRIANAHNYDFNIRGNQLVFYSRPQLESADAVGILPKTNVSTFRFHMQHIGERSYKSAVVTYFDPLSKKLLSALATDTNATSQDTLKIIERIENQQQGALRAQSHLHAANMHQIKAELVIPGTMAFRAGDTLNVSGFASFDTVKFIVKEAKHRLDKNGYKTTLELRTTITGAAAQIISDEDEE